MYYTLRCETCNQQSPLCSDTPGEMMNPDFEAAAETAGSHNVEQLQNFLNEHRDHDLREVELITNSPGTAQNRVAKASS